MTTSVKRPEYFSSLVAALNRMCEDKAIVVTLIERPRIAGCNVSLLHVYFRRLTDRLTVNVTD